MMADAFPLLRQSDGVMIVGRFVVNRSGVAQRMYETSWSLVRPCSG